LGRKRQRGVFPRLFFDRVAWVLRSVKINAEGDGQATDVMEIERPGDIADLGEQAREQGSTLAETKQLLAGFQQAIVAAQARDHAVRRPACPRCGGVCRVKDYQDHVVATLFGQVTVRLPAPTSRAKTTCRNGYAIKRAE
jgi:hypothetical protein